ncbi:MAG: TrkA C-terminal domain-containing protein [Bacillota bacterium]
MLSVLYGIMIIMFLLIIVEILAIALKITGLDMEKARFQVISIITGTGFTTNEAELITQHPTRRRIAKILMLISYVGTATMISVIISVINMMARRENILLMLFVIGAALLFVFFLSRNKWVLYRLERFIEIQLLKQMEKNKKYRTVEEVLKLNDEFGVAEFIIDERNKLIGLSLQDSGLKQKYIQVLNVDRGSHFIHFPNSKFIFQQGDRVVVYGQLESIKELVMAQVTA